MSEEGKAQVVRPDAAALKITLFPPTVWQTYSFAPRWFADALNEARTGKGHDARRREILFAVCFAESYLFEWVRDEVLNREFNKLVKYFPITARGGVEEKWKDVPKLLRKDGKIPKSPDLGGTHGEEWIRLVRYRNGLVHSVASRPETGSQPEAERPVPSKTVLDQLTARWAVNVVVESVRRLHDAAGTAVPEWIEEP